MRVLVWGASIVSVGAMLLFRWGYLNSEAAVASSHEDQVVEYLDVEGGVVFLVDRTRKKLTAETLNNDADQTQDGQNTSEAQSFEFGDCSDRDLVCADFEDYMLAVPLLRPLPKNWFRDGWRFEKTACFASQQRVCTRFAVKFENDEKHREGGFVFNELEGVELFYYTNSKLRDPRHIYVKSATPGLLQGGRP